MGILGKSELMKLIREIPIIHPFDEKYMDGDGYVLTVMEDVKLQYLEHRNVISNEIIFTPTNIVAHLTAKSRYGRAGLSFLNAAKVHSGFIGRLALEIVNLNNEREPVVVRKGDPFMHIEFISREGEPSPYEGEYQFQYMTREEIEFYISYMKKVFGKDFEAFAEKWRLYEKLK
ncbi:MAG: dCTP deaminase domain-containing protein [Thermoproteota archaeon]